MQQQPQHVPVDFMGGPQEPQGQGLYAEMLPGRVELHGAQQNTHVGGQYSGYPASVVTGTEAFASGPSAGRGKVTAHDTAAPASPTKQLAKQGGAMVMAKAGKCDRGAKGDDCGNALKIFREVPEPEMTADSWWMVGMIHKNVYDDVDPAVKALKKAVQLVDDQAGWWEKLARWAQILHHRLPEGGFENRAIQLARDAMKANHDLQPYSAPDWEEKVPGILEAGGAAAEGGGEAACKDPIVAAGAGEVRAPRFLVTLLVFSLSQKPAFQLFECHDNGQWVVEPEQS